MSRTYNASRSTTTTRGRGARPTRQAKEAESGRQETLSNGTGRGRGIGLVGRGISGRGMSNPNLPKRDIDGSENPDETGRNPETSQPSSEQQLSYCGGFSMMAPNQTKRQQLLDKAKKEGDQYEAYRQENKVKYVSYVGTVGGGEKTEAEARRDADHKQANSKLERMKKQQQWRDEKKQREDSKKQQQWRDEKKQREDSVYAQKKLDARRQTELKEQKSKADEKRREVEFRDDMRRKNNAFLDRLERSKPAEQPSASKAQVTPGSSRPTPEHVGSGEGRRMVSGTRANPVPAGSRSSEPAPQASIPEVLSTDYASQQTVNTLSEIDQLCTMFPNYSREALNNILEQTGSVDSAAVLLMG